MELHVLRAGSSDGPPPEAIARARLHWVAWGEILTEPQYQERERRLWRHPFSQRGLRLWFLSDGRECVASCETYAVPVLVAERKGFAPSRLGQGIATVFVEERLRGQGHASTLLRLVHEQLRGEGSPCSYLISEVGPDLYARQGYVPRPLRLRRYSAATSAETWNEPVTWLAAADIPALLEERYRQPARSPLTLQLSAEQLDWHHERGRFYAEAQRRSPPRRLGARCGEAFGIWAHDFRHRQLRVLCLYPGPGIFRRGLIDDPRSPEAVALRNVLHAARDEAGHSGLEGVEIWENGTNRGWLPGGLPLSAEDLPMLAPLRRGVSAEQWLDWERGHWL